MVVYWGWGNNKTVRVYCQLQVIDYEMVNFFLDLTKMNSKRGGTRFRRTRHSVGEGSGVRWREPSVVHSRRALKFFVFTFGALGRFGVGVRYDGA